MSAVAAVLFLTACAYLGAALYERVEPLPPSPEPSPAAVRDYALLQGIAVRTEQSFSSGGDVSGLENAGRIPCGALCGDVVAESSAVYFSETDGYEFLSPEMLDGLTAEGLAELLAMPPEERGDFRLVYGRDWYIAAFSDKPLPGSGWYRFYPDGQSGYYSAELVSAFSDSGGDTVVLLRLTAGDEAALTLRQVTGKLLIR